jgi:hypothetical protein
MKDNQKYLLLAAVGAAGVAYWYFNYGPGVTATTTTTAAATTTPSVVPLPGSTATPTASQSPYITNSGGVTLDATLYNWILAHPPAWYAGFFSTVFPQWNQNDVTIMDQILTMFNASQQLTGSYLTFWNTWFPNGTPQ